MSKTAPQKFVFSGFSTPNTTPIPDDFFDEVICHLSGAELKVMLYLMRRTFGFKKNSDDVSLSQICTGIIKKDGTILDRGTGLHRETASIAIQGLLDKRLIGRKKNNSVKNGNETSTFYLNFKGFGVGATQVDTPEEDEPDGEGSLNTLDGKSDQGEAENPTSLDGKSDPQETVPTQPDLQHSIIDNRNEEIGIEEEKGSEGKRTGPTSFSTLLADRKTSFKTLSDNSEAPKTISDTQSTDSRKSTSKIPLQHVTASPRLKKVIAEVSRDLADTKHLSWNIGQALNIYKKLLKNGAADFEATEIYLLGLLMSAKALTKERADEISGSKMAYFFSVVRDKAQLKTE